MKEPIFGNSFPKLHPITWLEPIKYFVRSLMKMKKFWETKKNYCKRIQSIGGHRFRWDLCSSSLVGGHKDSSSLFWHHGFWNLPNGCRECVLKRIHKKEGFFVQPPSFLNPLKKAKYDVTPQIRLNDLIELFGFILFNYLMLVCI